MPYFEPAVRAEPSATDNAVVRWDTTTGQDVQDTSGATLSDTNQLTLTTDNAQVISGGTLTGITVATISQTAKGMFLTESTSVMPNVMMVRAAAGNTAAPSFNFVRSKGTLGTPTVVSSGQTLGIFSFLGYDGTDFAVGGQIDGVVDESSDSGSGVGANKMGMKIRFLTSPDGTQVPTLALTIHKDKVIELAATGVIKIPNAGLKVLDTDATHYLIFKPGSNLTAERTLTITTGDADVTLDISAGFTGTNKLVRSTAPTLDAGSASAGSWPKLTGGTVMTTPEAGAIEYDSKVLYFSPEASNRGVIGAKYFIMPTSSNALTATTPEQALFDDVGGGVLTLPTGTYLWHALISMATMEAAAATNMAFDILGAGTATVTALYMTDGGENAINASGANTMSMSNQAQTPATMVTGAANANLNVRLQGQFRITAAGTIIPSVTLGTAGGTPTRSADSYFVCECIGSSTVQTVGQWS